MSLKADLSELGEKVQPLKDDKGMNWADIAEKLKVHPGKAMLAYLVVNVKPSERIKGKDDKELAKAIVAARDKEKLSWGVIAARADIPESRVRSLYRSVKGDDADRGNRIGKGGRYPEGAERPAPKSKAPAKAKAPAKNKAPAKTTAKKAAGSRKPAGGKKVAIQEMNQDQISARLTGKIIGVEGEDGKVKSVKVAKVVSLSKAGGNLVFEDAKGEERTVDVFDIKRAAA